MNQILEKLNDFGCDTKGAINRLLNNEETYLVFLNKYKGTFHVDELGEYLKEEKYQEAFDCVHNIKGATGNLGLTPLYSAASNLTEKLRAKDYAGLDSIYNELAEAYKTFLSIVE